MSVMASSVNKWRYWPEPDQPLPVSGAARLRERRGEPRPPETSFRLRQRPGGGRQAGRPAGILPRHRGGGGHETLCSTGGHCSTQPRLESADPDLGHLAGPSHSRYCQVTDIIACMHWENEHSAELGGKSEKATAKGTFD